MSTTDRRDEWRKSSFSDQGNGCVEVVRTLGAVRDSKNPEGPRLALDVQALVSLIKDGHYQG
ncbi:MAG: DUF397 domain-containing protein [Actinophytocola sp.]|uniref:DUF397 domain-containing protein n=1 Tax=Actinophytocola sp. TaxID=1872138 RepID=UPI0013261094|nr:DUF397 domain-containing protein [Actinophytocola sp.]MPZ80286.1 DUF397 domain-containing protein [Actinophytocola sp.]